MQRRETAFASQYVCDSLKFRAAEFSGRGPQVVCGGGSGPGKDDQIGWSGCLSDYGKLQGSVASGAANLVSELI